MSPWIHISPLPGASASTAGSCVLTPVCHALESTFLLTWKSMPAFSTLNTLNAHSGAWLQTEEQ